MASTPTLIDASYDSSTDTVTLINNALSFGSSAKYSIGVMDNFCISFYLKYTYSLGNNSYFRLIVGDNYDNGYTVSIGKGYKVGTSVFDLSNSYVQLHYNGTPLGYAAISITSGASTFMVFRVKNYNAKIKYNGATLIQEPVTIYPYQSFTDPGITLYAENADIVNAIQLTVQTVDIQNIVYFGNPVYAGGDLIVDGRIHASNNVGIKNTNPAYELDVTGVIRASSNVLSTDVSCTRLTCTNISATNTSNTAGNSCQTLRVLGAANVNATLAARDLQISTTINSGNISISNASLPSLVLRGTNNTHQLQANDGANTLFFLGANSNSTFGIFENSGYVRTIFNRNGTVTTGSLNVVASASNLGNGTFAGNLQCSNLSCYNVFGTSTNVGISNLSSSNVVTTNVVTVTSSNTNISSSFLVCPTISNVTLSNQALTTGTVYSVFTSNSTFIYSSNVTANFVASGISSNNTQDSFLGNFRQVNTSNINAFSMNTSNGILFNVDPGPMIYRTFGSGNEYGVSFSGDTTRLYCSSTNTSASVRIGARTTTGYNDIFTILQGTSNIGINKQDPQYTLDLNGSFRLGSNGWPFKGLYQVSSTVSLGLNGSKTLSVQFNTLPFTVSIPNYTVVPEVSFAVPAGSNWEYVSTNVRNKTNTSFWVDIYCVSAATYNYPLTVTCLLYVY